MRAGASDGEPTDPHLERGWSMSTLKKLRINKETMRALNFHEADQVAGGTSTNACAVSVAVSTGVVSSMITHAVGCDKFTDACGSNACGTAVCGSGTGGSFGGTGYCVSGSGPGTGAPPPPPPPPITTSYGDGTVCY